MNSRQWISGQSEAELENNLRLKAEELEKQGKRLRVINQHEERGWWTAEYVVESWEE